MNLFLCPDPGPLLWPFALALALYPALPVPLHVYTHNIPLHSPSGLLQRCTPQMRQAACPLPPPPPPHPTHTRAWGLRCRLTAPSLLPLGRRHSRAAREPERWTILSTGRTPQVRRLPRAAQRGRRCAHAAAAWHPRCPECLLSRHLAQTSPRSRPRALSQGAPRAAREARAGGDVTGQDPQGRRLERVGRRRAPAAALSGPVGPGGIRAEAVGWWLV
jgi:hypothetical protein